MMMPLALYRELATWATINFTYSYRNRREVTQLMREAREPEKIARLLKVLHDRLGHRIAFAAEEAKIALSEADGFELPLAFIEGGLSAQATRAGFDRAIRRGVERIGRAAADASPPPELRPGISRRSSSPAARAASGRARGHRPRRTRCPGHDGQRFALRRLGPDPGGRAALRLSPAVFGLFSTCCRPWGRGCQTINCPTETSQFINLLGRFLVWDDTAGAMQTAALEQGSVHGVKR
jgi:hypothetical protein